MTDVLTCRLKAYIQPFERTLALRELEAAAGTVPEGVETNESATLTYRVRTAVPPRVLLHQLAYWEVVGEEGGPAQYTAQSLREASLQVVRNGIPLDELARRLPFTDVAPLPNRRALRYGPHGIHEYRGKFFPQLVRALVNVARVPTGGVVADTMCGSGTTIAESVLGGYQGVGGDINPLSVFIARTKCALLDVAPETLARQYQEHRADVLRMSETETGAEMTHFSGLPEADQRYLRGWFSEQVLRDLDLVAQRITAVEPGPIRDLMTVGLSNILRRVSWQKEDDLRVRKEVRADVDIDPVREYLEELGRSVRNVLALLLQNRDLPKGSYTIFEASANDPNSAWSAWRGRVDAVVTSPPYATALPYLDTDRLSLSYLGLLTRSEHRRRDQAMIGNREVTDAGRRAYWERYLTDRDKLPASVRELIERIEELNTSQVVGFRRRNLAALLSKYFFDMRAALAQIESVLKPGGEAFVVVGNNHTTAGGVHVDIPTANLLSDVAATIGLSPQRHTPMEMLVSRDIFRKNALASEVILSFKKPVQ